jgi:hypothetical protein
LLVERGLLTVLLAMLIAPAIVAALAPAVRAMWPLSRTATDAAIG